MRWILLFFTTPREGAKESENYGFKTPNTPPRSEPLDNLESDLLNLAKNVKFRPTHNEFQNTLKADVARVRESPNILVFADKTSNIYELTPDQHKKLILENITKTYEKTTPKVLHAINSEAKFISEELKLSDRIECLAQKDAFVTLKDHKENFKNKLPCRVLNPSKSELGHISKVHLDRINSDIRKKLSLNQWKNTTEVINWFTGIDKTRCKFIQLDIREFYPSISEKILDEAVKFARKHTTVSEQNLRLIKHCRKSLLFFQEQAGRKKS